MKKIIKKGLFFLFIAWLMVFVIDFLLAGFNRSPFFAVPWAVYDDGGSAEYYGPGYKVIKYVELTPEKGTKVVRVDFGSWFMAFSPPEREIEHEPGSDSSFPETEINIEQPN